jgi:hypothetical protein
VCLKLKYKLKMRIVILALLFLSSFAAIHVATDLQRSAEDLFFAIKNTTWPHHFDSDRLERIDSIG